MFSSLVRHIPIAPIFLAAIFCSTISQAQLEPAPTPLAQASETPASPHRPTIGVALAGGGALGLAHIGVLQWMEENHIPVDKLAGTSMGALVGAFFATGINAAEMQPVRRKPFNGMNPCSPNPPTVNFPTAANKIAATINSAANLASSTVSTAPTDSIPATAWASCSTACPLLIPRSPVSTICPRPSAAWPRTYSPDRPLSSMTVRWRKLCAPPWQFQECSRRRNWRAECWPMAAWSITFPPTWSVRWMLTS